MSEDNSRLILEEINKIACEIRSEIEQAIDNPTNNYCKKLQEILKYSALANGKMIRSYLTYCFAEINAIDRNQYVKIAAAIEVIHTYSLIHDDLPAMDNSEMRRGQESSHVKYGEAVAILAGDALHSLAFKILANAQITSPANNILKLIALFAEAIGHNGMVLGQFSDIQGKISTNAEILRMQYLKTGKLIEFSCIAPFIISNKKDSLEYRAAKKYGELLGYAYQIKDDLLDISGKKEIVGKDVRQDSSNNKYNLVNLMGKEQAEIKLQEIVIAAKKQLHIFNNKKHSLLELTNYLLNRES
jgi:farnesyl diphosphate synthase